MLFLKHSKVRAKNPVQKTLTIITRSTTLRVLSFCGKRKKYTFREKIILLLRPKYTETPSKKKLPILWKPKWISNTKIISWILDAVIAIIPQFFIKLNFLVQCQFHDFSIKINENEFLTIFNEKFWGWLRNCFWCLEFWCWVGHRLWRDRLILIWPAWWWNFQWKIR